MMGRSTFQRHLAFETSHPISAAVYLAGVLALTMFAIHPLITSLSLTAAILTSCVCRGVAQTVVELRWQLSFALIIMLVNPLFQASGSTLLLKIGPLAVYQEALLFGACMGAMLVAALQWLGLGAWLLSTDQLLVLFGSLMPTVGLMLSMSGRLLPQLVRRGRELRSIHTLSQSFTPTSLAEKAAYGAQSSGVLMAWSLADSLETADAMRARGWSATSKRTSYRLYRFAVKDLALLATICLLLVAAALASWLACSQYHFYPTASELVMWWGYLPCALYLFMAAVLSVKEHLSWK